MPEAVNLQGPQFVRWNAINKRNSDAHCMHPVSSSEQKHAFQVFRCIEEPKRYEVWLKEFSSTGGGLSRCTR
eukprot:4558195-Pyramimonas_sp.AAC.2